MTFSKDSFQENNKSDNSNSTRCCRSLHVRHFTADSQTQSDWVSSPSALMHAAATAPTLVNQQLSTPVVFGSEIDETYFGGWILQPDIPVSCSGISNETVGCWMVDVQIWPEPMGGCVASRLQPKQRLEIILCSCIITNGLLSSHSLLSHSYFAHTLFLVYITLK